MKIWRNSFVRGIGVLTSATLLQNLITFGVAPILARLFTPEAFGIAGLIQVVAAIPVLAATGQYYMALGVARNQREAVNIAALSIGLVPLVAIATVPPVLVIRANAASLPESLVPIAAYLWVIPIIMLVSAILSISRIWEIRKGRYRSMVSNRLIESAGIGGAQIALGLASGGALGLILGRVLGTAAAAIHGLSLVFGPIGRQGLRAVSSRRIGAMARRHWRFPVYQLPAQALGVVARDLTPILLGALYSLSSVGLFWFANRLLERPAAVFGANVGRVYFQHAADRRQAGEPVFGLFWRSTGALAVMALLPFGLVMAYGPPLFALVFGAEWEAAGHYARWIALANFVSLLAYPTHGSTTLFGFQGVFAIVEAVRTVVGAVAIVLVAAGGGDELAALAAIATVQSMILLGYILFVGVRLRQLDGLISAAEVAAAPSASLETRRGD